MKKRLSCSINYLSSLTFTVIILIALTLTTCMNIMEAEIFSFLEGNLPQYETIIRSIFDFFGFSFLYQSWWFNTLLVLFSLNLLICTLKRIPQTIRILAPFRPGADQLLPSSLRHRETLVLNSVPHDFETKLRDFLSSKWSGPSTYYRDGSSVFFSQKGRHAFLGFYLAHLGLLLMLVGGIVSSFGYGGEVYVQEGKSVDAYFIEKQGDRFIKALDFSLRLDRCEALPPERMRDGAKREVYRSTITLLKNGEEVKTGTVEGSLTIKHENVRIAQASSLENGNYITSLLVTLRNAGGVSRVYTLQRHESIIVPETGHTIRIKNIFSPPRDVVKEGIIKISDVSPQEGNTRVARELVMLEVYGENQKLLYLPCLDFKGSRYWGPRGEDYEFSLLKVEKEDPGISSARLKISYEPGGDLIWMSLYVTIIGFAMMFLLSHRKLWVKVEEKDGACHITLGGWASRNPEMIESSFKDIKKWVCGHAMP